jgi:hypothetical protein
MASQMDDRPSKRRKTASPVRDAFPSYQSPTRASLARFNPALLPPPSRIRASLSSPLKPLSPRRLTAAGGDALRFVLGDKARKPARHTMAFGADAAVEHDRLEEVVQDPQDPEEDDAPLSNEDVEPAHGDSEPDPQVTPHGRDKVLRPSRASASDSDDDLPQTPQKLLNDPKFQDTPPRGILYSSTSRRRRTEASVPDLTLDSMQQEAIDAGGDTEPNAVEAPRRDALPDQRKALELEKKQGELYRLEKELEALTADIGDLERHIGLVGSTPEGSQYPDIDGLMYANLPCAIQH